MKKRHTITLAEIETIPLPDIISLMEKRGYSLKKGQSIGRQDIDPDSPTLGEVLPLDKEEYWAIFKWTNGRTETASADTLDTAVRLAAVKILNPI